MQVRPVGELSRGLEIDGGGVRAGLGRPSPHDFCRFDLLWLTCYKTWSCVMGFGEVAVLCLWHDNSDAAKLSIPVQVLQWKRVRNSGQSLPALCFLRAAGKQCAGSR